MLSPSEKGKKRKRKEKEKKKKKKIPTRLNPPFPLFRFTCFAEVSNQPIGRSVGPLDT